MQPLRLIKPVANAWKNASHDQRELSVCQELGLETIVIAKGEKGDKLREDIVDGFKVLRIETRPFGNIIPVQLNRIISLFIWAYYVRKLKADIISGRNLEGLFIGWLSSLFMKKINKPIFTYDAHEFGIDMLENKSKLSKWLYKQLEKFLIHRSAVSFMVSDSIADAVQRIHQLKERPKVVRNIPSYWQIDEAACKKQRKKFCNSLNVPINMFIIMYHGMIMRERNIEAYFKQVKRNPNIILIVLGDTWQNQYDAYMEELEEKAKELDVSNRILFHPSVPQRELWKYIGASDVGMVTMPNRTLNAYFSLPNKLFENIQSLTPVIVSDFPERSGLVKRYDIGLIVNHDDADGMAKCIERMRTDKEMYTRFKKNLRTAKEELCWEKEKNILKEAYKQVIDKANARGSR